MTDDDPVDDEIDHRLEWKLRAISVPVAFLLALAFHASSTGHSLQRTFLTMIPHELGHTFTAWLSGYGALPSLWKTLLYGRGALMPILVGAGNAALIYVGWRRRHTVMLGAGLVLGGLQLVLTTNDANTAQNTITFAGDGGAMILGTLLVLAFFSPAGSRLRFGGLRWGLLVIGAATLTDTFATWWSARTDLTAIPFGEIEGVGLSDPTKLQAAGWNVDDMIDRYCTLGIACVTVVAAATFWFSYRSWASRDEA